MIYNSLFLIGALDAAIKLGEALEEQPDEVAHWREFRAALAEAVNRAWDARKLAWPDSIDENGRPSEDVSVHTSMLAVIYDVAVAAHQAEVRTNVLSPRSELIPVASPFASLYFYEALEKLGVPGEIVDAIRRDYRPMLRAGASTVWETYARAFSHVGDFPTRSHCHGWSAAPLYYLPRLVLGIVPEGIGGDGERQSESHGGKNRFEVFHNGLVFYCLFFMLCDVLLHPIGIAPEDKIRNNSGSSIENSKKYVYSAELYKTVGFRRPIFAIPGATRASRIGFAARCTGHPVWACVIYRTKQ